MHFSTRGISMLLPFVILFFAATCYAERIPEHTCHFDSINNENWGDIPKVTLLQEVPKSKSSTWMAFTASSDEWSPIRIRTSSNDLKDNSKYCSATGESRADILGTSITCQSKDILTAKKLSDIRQILHSAIQMHAQRLKVQPIQHGFKVPELGGAFCSRFSVPKEHKEEGVKDADLLLYVASFPSHIENVFAAATPCATLESNGRPIVGAIALSTSHIAVNAYNVRVAAHEMAHTLGFAYKLLDSKQMITVKNNVRGKQSVKEIQKGTVLEKVKKHFECETATGMELEDENGMLKVPSHSHWERRNARDELMAPIVGRGLYTEISLALLEETGFYKAVFDKAESMEWGLKAKCDFLNEKCVKDGKSQFPRMFCADNNKDNGHCMADHKSVGVCSGFVEVTGSESVPEEYKYFTNEKHSGSKELMTDRCPIFESEKGSNCFDGEGDAVSGNTWKDSWCLRTAENNKQSGKAFYESVCVQIKNETKRGNTDEIFKFFFYPNKEAPCKNGQMKLEYPFENVVLECPSNDELRVWMRGYDEVLITTKSNSYNDEVTVISQRNIPDSAPTVVKSSETNPKSTDTHVTGGDKEVKKPIDTESSQNDNAQIDSSKEEAKTPNPAEKIEKKTDETRPVKPSTESTERNTTSPNPVLRPGVDTNTKPEVIKASKNEEKKGPKVDKELESESKDSKLKQPPPSVGESSPNEKMSSENKNSEQAETNTDSSTALRLFYPLLIATAAISFFV